MYDQTRTLFSFTIIICFNHFYKRNGLSVWFLRLIIMRIRKVTINDFSMSYVEVIIIVLDDRSFGRKLNFVG